MTAVRWARAGADRNDGSGIVDPRNHGLAPRRTAMLRRAFTLSTLALAATLAALPARAQDVTLTVFAAASMKNAVDDINAAFSKANSGIKVVSSYAASSARAKQIESGAPADLFASADLEWMDYVAKKNLIKPDTRVSLLGNRLVLIAPKDSKIDNVTIGQGFDLAKLAGDEDSHPAIIYPVALTKDAKPDAAKYLDFMKSNMAKTIFETYGFTFLIQPTS
jgi:molybdate transport system substrate-binding protein